MLMMVPHSYLVFFWAGNLEDTCDVSLSFCFPKVTKSTDEQDIRPILLLG